MQSYHDFLPPQEPVPAVDLPPVLSREGPFDASTEPAATSDHPLISAGLTRCPYHMTSYCEEDIAGVEATFSIQVHHPRFLESVGAPELACLLGHQPAEWFQVKDHRDTLYAVLQLQRDTGLMSSNMMVLQQYAIALHRMSTESPPPSVRSGVLPFLSGGRSCAGAQHVSGVNSDGGDRPLASSGWPGRSRVGYYTPGRGLPGLSHVKTPLPLNVSPMMNPVQECLMI